MRPQFVRTARRSSDKSAYGYEGFEALRPDSEGKGIFGTHSE